MTIQTQNINADESLAWSRLGITPGRYVCLSVQDNGMGMAPHVREHLFEPFFTTKEPGKGTGLGLSMIYGIVQQCGGTIQVESEPGQGTLIRIFLPRVDVTLEGRCGEESGEEYPTGNETVLVVEDEEEVRNLTVKVLRGQGYRVFEAAGGNEALLLCQGLTHLPQLLVADVVMPVMSGQQLAQQLALLCPKMKVLYISGYTDERIAYHGILAQGIHFLQKPFSPSTLVQKVRKVLGQTGEVRTN